MSAQIIDLSAERARRQRESRRAQTVSDLEHCRYAVRVLEERLEAIDAASTPLQLELPLLGGDA